MSEITPYPAAPQKHVTQPLPVRILLIHGVGKRTQFEFMTSFLTNFRDAIQANDRHADVEINYGDETPIGAETPTLQRNCVLVRWKNKDGREFAAQLEEVNWSELDERKTFIGWLKFMAWGLGMSGQRVREKPFSPESKMQAPKALSLGKVIKLRVQLFCASILFLLSALTIQFLTGILSRIGLLPKAVDRLVDVLYDYVGDVKLYQDDYARTGILDGHGERTRVTIRRRVVRSIVRAAEDSENGKIDGYYIFAHSLGTIAAYNAIMEPNEALPNYLSKYEWETLPDSFRCQVDDRPKEQLPPRQAWLSDTAGILRDKVYGHCRGLLTIGSPLNKFAAIWPKIVPTNIQKLTKAVPWTNVREYQDIVSGRISLLKDRVAQAGFDLQHKEISTHGWMGLFLAHIGYWHRSSNDKLRGKNLIEEIVKWIEAGKGASLKLDEETLRPVCLWKVWFWSLLIACAIAGFWASYEFLGWFYKTMMGWFGNKDLPEWASKIMAKLHQGWQCIESIWHSIVPQSLPGRVQYMIGLVIFVFLISVVRRLICHLEGAK